MSDAEVAPAPAAVSKTPAKKTPKKKPAAKAKKPANHPKYSDMIKKAVSALKERGGSSRQAILKYICANFKVDAQQAKTHLKLALRAGVKNGNLKQSKGTGASGSFRLGDKSEKKPKVTKAKKVTKPKAAKPKAKKVKKPKAAGAKKSPKKVKKTKAKKPVAEKKVKAAKPKAAKKAKKPKTPKKGKAAKK